jgi:membrane-associated HD superfamily phosphohydrolase
MEVLTPYFNQLVPTFSQATFWITLAASLLCWYALAVLFAHLLFGSGNREAVPAVKGGMSLSLLLMLGLLAVSVIFVINPYNWFYLATLLPVFLLIALLLVLIFGRLGAKD